MSDLSLNQLAQRHLITLNQLDGMIKLKAKQFPTTSKYIVRKWPKMTI